MLHVIIEPDVAGRGRDWQTIAFLTREGGQVRISHAPMVHVQGTRQEAMDLCELKGWRVHGVGQPGVARRLGGR